MPSLKDIVAALQRELDAAFAEGKTGSTGTAMELEKVTLSLAVDLLEKNASTGELGLGFIVLDGAKAAKSPGHRLALEMRVARATTSIAGTPATEAVIPLPPKPESVFGFASRVFGPPGFDNAARAEVFCEAIKELSEADTRMVLESVMGSVPLDEKGPLDGARVRIRRLLRFSPVGESAAAAALAEISRRFPIHEILQIISSRWKMTTGWPQTDDSSGRYSAN